MYHLWHNELEQFARTPIQEASYYDLAEKTTHTGLKALVLKQGIDIYKGMEKYATPKDEEEFWSKKDHRPKYFGNKYVSYFFR